MNTGMIHPCLGRPVTVCYARDRASVGGSTIAWATITCSPSNVAAGEPCRTYPSARAADTRRQNSASSGPVNSRYGKRSISDTDLTLPPVLSAGVRACSLPVVEREQAEHGPHAQNDADEAQYRAHECVARQLRCELRTAGYE